MKFRSRLASAGGEIFVLLSIFDHFSAAAVTRTSRATPSSFVEPITILSNSDVIAFGQTEAVSFETVTEAIFTLSDDCTVSVLENDGSMVIVPGYVCSGSAPKITSGRQPLNASSTNSSAALLPLLSSWTSRSAISISSPVISTPTTKSSETPNVHSGPLTSPITLPPVITTMASSRASSSISSVSSVIGALLPTITSWKANPTVLKSDTLAKIKEVQNDVKALIADLGGGASSSGCHSKKRGLFGFIGDIVNTLSCIDKDLDDIENTIIIDDIGNIDKEIDDLKSENENLSDQNDRNSISRSDLDSNSRSTSTRTLTSASSSCASLSTVLKVTVLCLPTSLIAGGSTVLTTTCSPSATVTTSGCFVTALTTTVSSSLSASATQLPCAPDTCGEACSISGGPLSGASMGLIANTENCALISTSTTSVLPTGNPTNIVVVSPTPQYSPASYNEIPVGRSLPKRVLPEISPPYANYVQSLNPYAVWVSQVGNTSGQWFPYPVSGHSAAGVNGLYGCTAVIIASEKGVYISHIWENPVFLTNNYSVPTDDGTFTNMVFNALRDGTMDAKSILSLVGTDRNPGPLHVIHAPKVFVLTPFTTNFDRNSYGITTTLRYQARAEQLAQYLARSLLSSADIGYTLGYTRTNPKNSTNIASTAGRAILEVDPFQTWLTTAYAPHDPGLQVGRWRLWVEDQLVTSQDFWVPNISQKRGVGYANPCGNYTNAPSSSNVLTSSNAPDISSSSSRTFIETPPPYPQATRSTHSAPSAVSISTTSTSPLPSRTTSSRLPPTCSEGNNSLMGLNNYPAAWCFCAGRGPFATIPQATTSYCAFSSLPANTISLTSISTSIDKSCSLTTTTYTTSGANPTSQIFCQCGNEMAGYATMTRGGAVIAGCELAPTWSIMSTLSTLSPTTAISAKSTVVQAEVTISSTSPPYHTGVCDLHIYEASRDYNEPLYVQLNVTDGENYLLASNQLQLSWGDSANVTATDSSLPYDIIVDFTQTASRMARKRSITPVVPATVDWKAWILTITAGATKWVDTDSDESKLPYCEIGGWDDGNFWDWVAGVLGIQNKMPDRSMDCHWEC